MILTSCAAQRQVYNDTQFAIHPKFLKQSDRRLRTYANAGCCRASTNYQDLHALTNLLTKPCFEARIQCDMHRWLVNTWMLPDVWFHNVNERLVVLTIQIAF